MRVNERDSVCVLGRGDGGCVGVCNFMCVGTCIIAYGHYCVYICVCVSKAVCMCVHVLQRLYPWVVLQADIVHGLRIIAHLTPAAFPLFTRVTMATKQWARPSIERLSGNYLS